MGHSGDFSRVGARVFSAHFFSASEGWRFSKMSAIGLSATRGFDGFFGMRSPVVCFDARQRRGPRAGAQLSDGVSQILPKNSDPFSARHISFSRGLVGLNKVWLV